MSSRPDASGRCLAGEDPRSETWWTAVQFEQALCSLEAFVDARGSEMLHLFPATWGVPRMLVVALMNEARLTLLDRLQHYRLSQVCMSSPQQGHVRARTNTRTLAKLGTESTGPAHAQEELARGGAVAGASEAQRAELQKMRDTAAEFEAVCAERFPPPLVPPWPQKADAAQVTSQGPTGSEAGQHVLTRQMLLRAARGQTQGLLSDAFDVCLPPKTLQCGNEATAAAVFALGELDDSVAPPFDSASPPGVAQAASASPQTAWVGPDWGPREDDGERRACAEREMVGLERWGSGLEWSQADLGLIAVECLLLSSELSAGSTSFGQVETDRGALRVILVAAEMTAKSKRSSLSMLDAAAQSSAPPQTAAAKTGPAVEPDGAAVSGTAATAPPPLSLEYRLALLLRHRPFAWKPFHVEGRDVSFAVWRACQLRLLLLLCHIALASPQAEPGVIGSEGQGGWKLGRGERELSATQLKGLLLQLATDIAGTDAPSEELWFSYCEAEYVALVARLHDIVRAVLKRCPWLDNLGPLRVFVIERLLEMGARGGGGVEGQGSSAEVVRMLRCVGEGYLMGEAVVEAAQAATAMREYEHTRHGAALSRLITHLSAMQVAPAWSPGLSWYKQSVVEQAARALHGLLSDAHANFIDPAAEIPLAVEAFAYTHGLLHAGGGGQRDRVGGAGDENASAMSTGVQQEVSAQLKASVASRFRVIFRDQVLADGVVNVEECILAVEHLAEEVEVEALYFAPGYASVVPSAVGLAVLEYVVCCKRSVELCVESFRTLSGEAVRLWRALEALTRVVARILPRGVSCEEASGSAAGGSATGGSAIGAEADHGATALQTLAGLRELFRRCVQSWLDDQASRYAEMLANCIVIEKERGWAPLAHTGVSCSVVDLFHMFHATVPQLFQLGLPLAHDDVLACIAQVDLFVMKYCNELVTQHHDGRPCRLDAASLMPVFAHKKDTLDRMTDKMDEMFSAEGRQAARQRKGKIAACVGSQLGAAITVAWACARRIATCCSG